MKINSKRTEENRIVLDEEEKDLVDKCSDLIESLMNELSATDNGDVTLFFQGVENDRDCCDTYATKNELYDKLEDVSATLMDLLMADAILVKSEDEY